MATSLMSSVNLASISSPISTETSQNREQLGTGFGLSKTSFLCGNTNKLFSTQSKRVQRFRKFKSVIAASSFNHIPKQFREENLKEGLMENYKNVPQHLFGLSSSQMNLFSTEDSPILRQSEKLKEESISSARAYLDNGGMMSMSGMKDGGQTFCSMNTRMYRGGGSGYPRTRGAPPDLPSLLMDGRIVYLGMPIVPAVAELLVAQLIFLDFDAPDKPIYLYINSLGIRNEQGQMVSSEVDAYAVADMLGRLRCRIYTVNVGCAYGQAAMLLAYGTKGYRFLQPNSTVKLYLPKMDRMNGQTSDIYIEAKELQATTEIFLELLSRGTGKPADVLREDIKRARSFNTQAAIDYGIADKLVKPEQPLYERDRNYAQLMAESKANRVSRGRPGGAQASPFGS